MVIDVIDIAITKISSKEMRDNFSVGEKLFIIKSGERLILKKTSGPGKKIEPVTLCTPAHT